MKTELSVFFAVFLFQNIYSQEFSRVDVPFYFNGHFLETPLTGGLNSPQFNEVDLDNDGILDLHIFDRIGNVHITYLNKNITNEVLYEFTPEYSQNFPDCYNWVVLKDYNGDGIEDIFTHYGAGINGAIVYKGFYDNGKINFERVNFYEWSFNVLSYPLTGGGRSQIYIANADYPAIEDIDNDGDLDILSFEVNGTILYFYQNLSVELGFGLDSLKFNLNNDCWGRFREGIISEDIIFGEDINSCGNGFTGVDVRHAGSTLLAFDADNDNDFEIIVGDISNPNLYFLHNESENGIDFMTEAGSDFSFPSNSIPVDIPLFPGIYMVDLNNDGAKDVIAAPNDYYNTPDKKVAWYYKNTTSNEYPVFEYQQDNLFMDEILDFGTDANPTLIDYNADGLMDLIVGNGSEFDTAEVKGAKLFLFKNTGSSINPVFQLIDDDYLNFSSIENIFMLTPTFGDMDNDGDMDFLCGEKSGKLFYAENTAGAGNPFQFSEIDFFYKEIDVGQYSTPNIVDINRDGLPDLLIGERNGNVDYLPNIGTASQPDFHSNPDEEPNNYFFGHIDTHVPGIPTGSSAPLALDFDTGFKIFCGTETGKIRIYSNIDDNLTGEFTLENPDFGNIRAGAKTHPVISDINHNGYLDVLVGNKRGGISIFTSDILTATLNKTTIINSNSAFNVFPNPVKNVFIFKIPKPSFSKFHIKIYNLSGKVVFLKEYHSNSGQIDVSNFPTGTYFLKAISEKGIFLNKIIISH